MTNLSADWSEHFNVWMSTTLVHYFQVQQLYESFKEISGKNERKLKKVYS